MAFQYAGDQLAWALRDASAKKEELKSGPLMSTSSGSSQSSLSPAQEKVGGTGEFAQDVDQFGKSIYARAEEAFAFGRNYLNGQDPGALA